MIFSSATKYSLSFYSPHTQWFFFEREWICQAPESSAEMPQFNLISVRNLNKLQKAMAICTYL